MRGRELVAVGLLGAAGVLGCGSQGGSHEQSTTTSRETQGDIELGLVPVTGVTLSSVHYVVTSSAALPISEGDLPTPGSAKAFSFGLSLPVGTGYTISLSAASAETGDNVTCGGSFSPFDVAPNSTSNFSITLTCHDDSNGSILGGIDVKTDACPRLVIDYVVATPSRGEVGVTNLHSLASAHDLDGKAVTYAWQGSSLTFNPTTGPASTFTCAAAGQKTVTLTASNGECQKKLETTVSCSVNVDACGNGVVDPGESCDKAIPGSLCPPDCIAECGNGIAESPIEDCDPGNTDNCNSVCRFRTPFCGDGFLTTVGPNPEVCDGNKFATVPPPGVICSPTCGLLDLGGPCGDGIVGLGEECDAGPSSSPSCSNTCQKVSTQACVDCENNGLCAESVDNCHGVDTVFDVQQQTQCYSVMRCIERSNCLDGTGSLSKCYCGDLDTGPCGAAPFTGPGSPNGACVAEIKAGFPIYTTNQQVLGGLTATDFPSGAAMKRLNCQKSADQSACITVCGLNAGGPVFP